MIDISIVTATYNRAHLLTRAWNSLKAQPPRFEWIVVDDASSDNTEDMIRMFDDLRIIYIKQSTHSGGPNPARNAGARAARGRYVVFLDDDDELYPGSMAQMLDVMEHAAPDVGVAIFQCVPDNGIMNLDGVIDGALYNEADLVCEKVPAGERLLVYRKQVFDDYELPENLLFSEGVFVFQVAKKYKFLMVAQPGRIYHQHDSNVSQPRAMIARSRQIAMGHEQILHNHSAIFDACAECRNPYLMKALYRYIVAGDLYDARRIYRALFHVASAKNLIVASGIMLLGCTRTAKLAEIIRIGWLRSGMHSNLNNWHSQVVKIPHRVRGLWR